MSSYSGSDSSGIRYRGNGSTPEIFFTFGISYSPFFLYPFHVRDTWLRYEGNIFLYYLNIITFKNYWIPSKKQIVIYFAD
jgi:hypothetical protein